MSTAGRRRRSTLIGFLGERLGNAPPRRERLHALNNLRERLPANLVDLAVELKGLSRLKVIASDCLRLPPIASDCLRLPPIGFDCLQLPPITSGCLRLPSISVELKSVSQLKMTSRRAPTISHDLPRSS